MNRRSRSTLFLMEQLIVITIFALCASVCVRIFVGSSLMANETRDNNHALVAAKNGAECYKVYRDPGKVAAVLTGHEHAIDASSAPYSVVYYDTGWRVCSSAEAAYVMRLENIAQDEAVLAENVAQPLLCELSVEKVTGEKFVGFTVSARRVHKELAER